MEQTLGNYKQSFWKKAAIWPYWPIVLLGCIYFIIHLRISPNFADDQVFASIASTDGFNIFQYSVSRYLTWSSRTLLEVLLMWSVSVPPIFWKICDTLIIIAVGVFLSKLLFRDEYRMQGNLVIAALLLLVPYQMMSSAGWIATTVNYIWPLAFGLISLYPLRKLADGQKIRGYEYVLYSVCLLFGANQEQMCAILTAIYGFFTIYMFVKKKIHIYVFIQFVLCILSLVYILLAPGNDVRTVQETATWYPEHGTFSLMQKMMLGVVAAGKDIIFHQNWPFLILCILSCMLVWQKNRKVSSRVLALVPPFFAASLFAFLPYSAGYQALLFNPEVLLASAKAAAAVLVSICVLACLIYSLRLVFKQNAHFWLSLGILFLGFASRVAIGLSPTIWASLDRTALFFLVSLIACIVFLLNEWDFKNKNATYFLLIAAVSLGVYGGVSNFFAVV